jgi:hypothetical protein
MYLSTSTLVILASKTLTILDIYIASSGFLTKAID